MIFLSLSLYLFLTLTSVQGAHTLFSGHREGEKMLKIKRERKRERETERKREMYNMVIEFIYLGLTIAAFLFLKGMTGVLAPFSYLI
jgi:hypothetical protein